MIIKRYSFPDLETAKNLILSLLPEDNIITFDNISITENTHCIVILGFQNKYEYDLETEQNILVHQGITYDVDIMWKTEFDGFAEFEVFPNTPNHGFAVAEETEVV